MCDMIVASESAVFGQPEINLGVIPGAGGTQRLVRAVGKSLAMEIILNDRRLSAEEAHHHGLVNHVYPTDSYLDEALALANQIAARAPIAARLAKDAVNRAYELTLAEGLAYERRSFAFVFGTEDQAEGMNAFLEKRDPQWKGR
jgi:enoyl-CoA hydratase